MPWNKTCPMDERLKFIAEWMSEGYRIADLARCFDISRKTAHKWIQRYKQKGLYGLDELSRAPKTHPQATAAAIEHAVLAFRRQKPYWGPKKLLHRLRLLEPGKPWPSASTIGAILKRHGLSKDRRVRRRVPAPVRPSCLAQNPNDVWTADFKGWFRTQDKTRVDPLTIADMTSRYLLACDILVKPKTADVQARFEHAFRTFGLPLAIRTDNGWPFASLGLAGLSRLSTWWIRLGITPDRIRPAHPEENGSHERMHRSLKEQIAKPPAINPAIQQQASDHFRWEFNTERPHESLGMRTPDQGYTPSIRPFPNKLPEIAYAQDFQVRRVRPDGMIKWESRLVFISEVLSGEWIGMKPMDNDRWIVQFGPMPLAIYDANDRRLRKLEQPEDSKV